MLGLPVTLFLKPSYSLNVYLTKHARPRTQRPGHITSVGFVVGSDSSGINLYIKSFPVDLQLKNIKAGVTHEIMKVPISFFNSTKYKIQTQIQRN